MKYNLAFACAAMLLLPACLKSDDSDVPDDSAITLENLGDRAEAFAALDLDPSLVAVPTGDGVAYRGVAVYGERTIPVLTAAANAKERADIIVQDPSLFLAVGAAEITANMLSGNVEVSADNFFEIDDPETLDLEEFSNIDGATGTAISGTMSGTLTESRMLSALDEPIDRVGIPAPYSGKITGSLTRVGDTESTPTYMVVSGGFLGDNSEAFIATTPGFDDNPYVSEFNLLRPAPINAEPLTGTRMQRELIQLVPEPTIIDTFGGVVGVVVPD